MTKSACFKCRASLALEPPIARDATCAACNADVRCCLNCRHYDRNAHGECRETEAEFVVDKDRRNFCEYFELVERQAGGAAGPDRAAEARAKLDAMFGGAPKRGEDAAPSAREALERLFRKDPEKAPDSASEDQ